MRKEKDDIAFKMHTEESKVLEESVQSIVFEKVASEFPKPCTNCKRVYETELEYTVKTERQGNVKEFSKDKKKRELFFMRNCICGGTLGISFNYSDLDAFQLFRFMDHVRELELEAKSKLKHKIKEGAYRESKLWEFISSAVKEEHTEDRGEYSLPLQDQIKEYPHMIFVDKIPGKKSYDGEKMWFEVGLSLFRDRYNHWLRTNPNLPKSKDYRVIVIDDDKKPNSFIAGLRLENGKIDYTSSIQEGKEAINANPEGTSLILLTIPEDYAPQKELVGWLRKHDGIFNSPESPRQTGYIPGGDFGTRIPVIGLSTGNKNFDININDQIAPDSIKTIIDAVHKYCPAIKNQP
jgi:hypothetical protein